MVFNALGGAEHDLPRAQMRGDAGQRGAQKLRGDDGDQNIGGRDGAAVAGYDEVRRDRDSGKKLRVLAGVRDLLRELEAVRPERDLVAAAAVERERDSGSPCAGTEHGNAAHAGFLAPKRASVPLNRRRMFWWCLTTMSRAMKHSTA